MKHSVMNFHLRAVFAVAIAVLFAVVLFGTPSTYDASAAKGRTCFCKIAMEISNKQTSMVGVFKDLTNEVNQTFTLQGQSQQKSCREYCENVATKYVKSPEIAQSACAAGVPDGTYLVAYSAVGTSAYSSAKDIGRLRNGPDAPCSCPAGWTFSRKTGDLATEGRCKKLACQQSQMNLSSGFSWGNAFYVWGSSANGGEPTCTKKFLKKKVCTCPSGWISNTSQQDGGVTTDSRCKKMVCQPIKITPLPPDGTALNSKGELGSWGFVSGTLLFAWGSRENGGGSPNCLNPANTPYTNNQSLCGWY